MELVMTNTSHTPGPWRVIFESIDPEWSVVTDARGNIVANVNSETGPDVPPLVSTKMPRDANARLIAAAPDLLAALEAVMNHPHVRAYLPYSPTDAVFSGAMAAIAKAKG